MDKKLKAKIKKIVAWQFDNVTNLSKEAYESSLDMIAEQILALFNTKK